jgi:hypothetical protein
MDLRQHCKGVLAKSLFDRPKSWRPSSKECEGLGWHNTTRRDPGLLAYLPEHNLDDFQKMAQSLLKGNNNGW